MIRVLVCDHDASRRARLRAAVERFASSNNLNTLGVTVGTSSDVLSDATRKARRGFYNLIICGVDAEGADRAVRALRDADGEVEMVLVSNRETDAATALDVDAGFFPLPNDYEGFSAVIGQRLLDLARRESRMLAIKSPSGVENMPLDEVLFVESAKKGPIVHLAGGTTVSARGTLQALFERFLQADAERFVKVGGSFIVNLDNIRSTGESSVIFPDGEAIIIPVRTRKPLKDALTAYCTA